MAGEGPLHPISLLVCAWKLPGPRIARGHMPTYLKPHASMLRNARALCMCALATSVEGPPAATVSCIGPEVGFAAVRAQEWGSKSGPIYASTPGHAQCVPVASFVWGAVFGSHMRGRVFMHHQMPRLSTRASLGQRFVGPKLITLPGRCSTKGQAGSPGRGQRLGV